ncbi:hypothetical protein WR25_18456 [Diploscapter pachys]|uniref:Uncharacterized protein n=1 Tax=Diploscapter pachys TaxID=2018661 RepID=A0A2A2LLY9_9BILA|nr:hypothetical protein WR25_18456 [Diploscapter pachys]
MQMSRNRWATLLGEGRKLDFVWEDMEMLVKWGEIENKGEILRLKRRRKTGIGRGHTQRDNDRITHINENGSGNTNGQHRYEHNTNRHVI